MSETEFEKRIRELAATNPRLSVSTAVMLADRGEDVLDFPEDPDDIELGAVWALQFPAVVDLIAEGKMIHAIKELRALAPPRVHRNSFGRPVVLGLLQAKNIGERARDLMTVEVSR